MADLPNDMAKMLADYKPIDAKSYLGHVGLELIGLNANQTKVELLQEAGHIIWAAQRWIEDNLPVAYDEELDELLGIGKGEEDDNERLNE